MEHLLDADSRPLNTGAEPGGFDVAMLPAMGITSVVLVIATLPPFVGEGLVNVIMSGFAFVCHQLPERSPHVNGVQLAICHRCLGIYAGLIGGTLVLPWLARWDRVLTKRAGVVIVLSLVPAGIDWLAGLAGVWASTPALRIATGILFGLAAGFYFGRAVYEIVGRKSRREAARQSVRV